MRTLYLSDLDGTLLTSAGEVSRDTGETLAAFMARGGTFTVATARGPSSAMQTLRGVKPNAPAVLMNGALLYDAEKDEIVRSVPLQSEAARALCAEAKAASLSGFLFAVREGKVVTYCEQNAPAEQRAFMEERERVYHKKYARVDSFESVWNAPVIYFNLVGGYGRLEPLYRAFKAAPKVKCVFYRDVYEPALWFLEAFGEDASKGSAVKWLKQAYGFERVVAFGDNFNDLTMFDAADYAVAVENAVPEAKARANEICGANDADGVARWIVENE